MKKKIFIAGGGGMLGEAFYNSFNQDFDLKVTDIDLNSDWISYLDFREADEYRNQVINFAPDYLFHLGAYTDLEFCEENIDDTYATNTLAVGHAISICNELSIPLLYISTAGIFDGKKELYDETDIPNPIGHYARSKFLGEKLVQENKKDCLICRAGWMMGGGKEKDKKFIGKILRLIESGQRQLDIVDDKFGTPTYTHDFAVTVKQLLEKEAWGLYNMACSGITDRVEITRVILNILQLEDEIAINKVSSDYFRNEYFAPRPASERLINKKLDESGLNLMRDWKVCLREYIERDYPHVRQRVSSLAV